MKKSYIILLIVFLILFIQMEKKDLKYVVASNGKSYLIRNEKDRQEAVELLKTVDDNIQTINKHLMKNIKKYPEYKPYIKQLNRNIKDLQITENSSDEKYTSYSVNKGEQLVLCLRSRKTKGLIHDINLIMYVAIHEVAHIACPEIDHTPLFIKIFKFLLNVSQELNIYKNEQYDINPVEYCGMVINENLFK